MGVADDHASSDGVKSCVLAVRVTLKPSSSQSSSDGSIKNSTSSSSALLYDGESSQRVRYCTARDAESYYDDDGRGVVAYPCVAADVNLSLTLSAVSEAGGRGGGGGG